MPSLVHVQWLLCLSLFVSALCLASTLPAHRNLSRIIQQPTLELSEEHYKVVDSYAELVNFIHDSDSNTNITFSPLSIDVVFHVLRVRDVEALFEVSVSTSELNKHILGMPQARLIAV